MKKKPDKLGKFGILGAVLSFLVGYPLSGVIRSAFRIESYALTAAIYFSVTTLFAAPFIKIGRIIDGKKTRQHEEDDEEDE